MSYDLSLRPKSGHAIELPSLERVTAVLVSAGARSTEEADHFEASDRVSGEVTIDPVVGPNGVSRIDVSTSFTTDTPSDLYRLCAHVCRELGWKAYDPQGDSWLSAKALAKAAADDTTDEDDTADENGITVGGGTLLGGALFLPATFLWAINGAHVFSVGFWVASGLGVLTVVLRLYDWRRFRRNQRAV